MTAPRRWKDTHDAPVGVRELLSAARPPRSIDGASFDRGAARVAKLSAAPAAAAAAGVAVGMWTKLAAAAAIGVASVTAVVAVKQIATASSDEGAPPPLTPRLETAPVPSVVSFPAKLTTDESPPAKATTETTDESPPAAKLTTDETRPPAAKLTTDESFRSPLTPRAAIPAEAIPAPIEVPTAVAPRAPAAAPPSTLAEEIPLLEQARASLARDPATSLARTAQHRARHPHGVLAAERDLIELDALRRTGRTSEARDRARAWLARDPSGLHAARVRAILEALDDR